MRHNSCHPAARSLRHAKRMDVPHVEFEKLASDRAGESSKAVRQRVLCARERELARFDGSGLTCNADTPALAAHALSAVERSKRRCALGFGEGGAHSSRTPGRSDSVTAQTTFAFVQYFSLPCVLWYKGNMPRDYARFLDYAYECIFLRKVGGYIFIHSMLMEYFASLDAQPSAESNK